MLKFIIGTAGSGKTYEVFSKIKKELNNNKEIVLLVPEQFVFECEKALLEFCGAKSSLVNVCSFTKLCNNILNDLGGKKANIIDDLSKNMIVGLAIKQVKESLKYYGKCKITNNFSRDIAAIITIFKQAKLTPNEIELISEKTTEQNFSNKLYDFSLIMKAYDSIIKNKFLDSESLLEIAKQRTYENSWFKNKIFFIDSFTGFTAAQMSLIEEIIKNSEDVYFSFCSDSIVPSNKINVFRNIKFEIESIKSIAKKYSVEIAGEQIMKRAKASDLDFLEKLLSNNLTETFNQNVENIEICEADSKYSEIDYIAQKILYLIQNNNYKFKDFAVVTADNKEYKNIIDSVFNKYNIPCYIDRRTEIKNLPIVTLVLCLIKSTFNLESNTVFKLLKTQLLNFKDQEISDLEDYVYIWSINGKQWLNNWNMNPNGFEETGTNSNFEKQLEYINSIRKKVVDIICKFKDEFSCNSVSISKLIYNTLIKLNVPENLKNYSEELNKNGNFLESKIQIESWDSLINVLDRINKCYGEDKITAEEYYNIFLQSATEETVGTVPQQTDEVIFGSADRIRTGFIKVMFLVGVNQGKFPSLTQTCGLLTTAEREKLILNGAKIPDRSINDIIENKYRFYNAACTPTDKVFFVYNKGEENGQASDVIDTIITKMPTTPFVKYSDCNLPNIEEIVAVEPLFDKMLKNYNTDKVSEYKYYFENDPNYKSKIETVNLFFNSGCEYLSKEKADALYNKNIYVSASKIDTFYKCRFSYFCRYGLNLKKLNKAEISAVIRGTIAHYILEKVISLNKDNICDLTNDKAKEDINNAVIEYFNKISVNCEDLSYEIKNNINSIKVLTLDLIMQIVEEFKLSDFKILDCEVEIGESSEIKPLKLNGNVGNNKITVKGKIDRVDYYTENDKIYLRVVDYKTNSKIFELSDVFYGQNLQMLVYLYTLLKNKSNNNLHPAGILYLPIKKLYSKDEYNKMNGVLLSDYNIISHMSDTPEKFLPVSFNKGEKFSGYSKVMTEEEFNTVFNYLENKIIEMGDQLSLGSIGVIPTDSINSDACKYCEFRAACKKDVFGKEQKVEKMPVNDIIEKMNTYLSEAKK